MAVLVRHRVTGMTPEQYDQAAPALIEKLKTTPGFLYHVAFVDEGGGFTVSEIWESKEKHDRWFSENVEGVIPGVEQQVIKVHAVARAVAGGLDRRRAAPHPRGRQPHLIREAMAKGLPR